MVTVKTAENIGEAMLTLSIRLISMIIVTVARGGIHAAGSR